MASQVEVASTDPWVPGRLLIGVMVDVSRFMQTLLNLRNWAEAANATRIVLKVFQVVSDVAHRAARPEDQIAVTAFGTQFVPTCDLLQLFAQAQELHSERKRAGATSAPTLPPQPATNEDISNVLRILQSHGAPLIRNWIEESALKNGMDQVGISHADVVRISQMLIGPDGETFVKDLPLSVRGLRIPIFEHLYQLGNNAMSGLGARASPADILHHIQRALDLAGIDKNIKETVGMVDASDLKAIMLKLPKTKPWPLSKATELFQSLQSLNEGEVENVSAQSTGGGSFWNASAIVDLIEPCIYAGTPLCAALEEMANVFQNADSDNKILFILSDGASADGNPRNLAANLKERGVTIVSCLLTNVEIPNPRQLLGLNENPGTSDPCRAMYDMSSSVSNGSIAMRMLAQQGWKISTTGESHLFVQANHSAVINEFVAMVGRLLCSNDVLVDIVARISLDLHVQDCRLSAQEQVGGTCYANAIGAVYHMAMTRIYARQGGVPDFEEIRKHIIKDHGFGYNGADVVQVLEKVSSDYRLHSKEVDETGAREALNRGRPVVAFFALRSTQWSEFSNFFAAYKQGTLDVQHISRRGSGDLGGHAVVFIGYDRNSMWFMNSWGKDFANNGFFKIRSVQVLSPNQQPMRFFDVFWYEYELSDGERQAYRQYSVEEVKRWAQRHNHTLQILDYKCPLCGEKSRLNDFQGNIFHASCPRCQKEFTPKSIGEEFLTNIYVRRQ